MTIDSHLIAEFNLTPEDLICDECGQVIEDEISISSEGYHHTACCEAIEEKLRKEAEEFAKANCKITAKLHRFDESKEWACSPDDYEMGMRESYTANSVASHNRHNCTNYDKLRPDRNDDSARGQAYYGAIRDRIEELLNDADDNMYNLSENDAEEE